MNQFSKSWLNGHWHGTSLMLLCLTFLIAYLPSASAQQSAEENYGHKCAVCHGKDGLGNTAKGKKVHVKDVHANMKDSEADMIKVVTEGKGDDMDSYKSEFTASQIKDLVDYYRSLGQK
jgi:mono/diheme cytochrome c family protein